MDSGLLWALCLCVFLKTTISSIRSISFVLHSVTDDLMYVYLLLFSSNDISGQDEQVSHLDRVKMSSSAVVAHLSINMVSKTFHVYLGAVHTCLEIAFGRLRTFTDYKPKSVRHGQALSSLI